MKITAEQLQALINETLEKHLANQIQLQEAAENGTEMTSAKDMTDFMRSFDKLIEKSIEDARKLADEGEALLKANLLKNAEAEVRNEIVKYRVGMLRTMANNMATVFERVKRFEP